MLPYAEDNMALLQTFQLDNDHTASKASRSNNKTIGLSMATTRFKPNRKIIENCER